MSFLSPIRSGTRHLPQYLKPSLRQTTVSIHTSAPRLTLKESDKNRDDLPNIYESQKEAQLKKTKEGKAHWEPDLASNSEADVKADRGELQGDKAFQEVEEKNKKKKAL
ncbi:uncharacterized protein N7469_007268 [Penicillium citrinum]|uniref:Uncharacterized protein n=2 Tax=Penicillium TaxID=5073 RepID=A0A9W9NW45_PENCI|nr:uncharacterized protein N7469_007268 [Penicillium citrinum]KAJ5227262.1 hypothetical protein N7469_007268 [Penicillium citrinum]KAJ5568270.1 hypothetical protein N7450_010756 [Penicillium hetheringtonii]